MSEQVLAAFNTLIARIDEEKPRLANSVQKAILQSKFDEGHELMAKAQRVDTIGQQIAQLMKTWEGLFETAITKTQISTVAENDGETHFGDKETISTKPSVIRQIPNNERGLIGSKILVSKMENRVNGYRRYGRLLYIVSINNLDKHRDLLEIEPSMHFALFKEEYTSQGKKYRFVKALAPQASPSALCDTIDQKICGVEGKSNGVNQTTFSRHFKWDFLQYPVPTIEELVQNIII